MAEETFEIDDLEQDLDKVTEASRPSASKRNLWVVLIVAGVLVLGLVLFFMTFLNGDYESDTQSLNPSDSSEKVKKIVKKKKKKVKYVVLYSKVTASDMSSIIKELSYKDISFKLAQSGKDYSLSVDQKKFEEAKVLLALKGLPSGGLKGYQLLDEAQTLGVTEFDKKVRYLRALSGELEKVIMKLEMIEDAKVQIVIPKERLFVTKQPPVTAGILVRPTPGYKLTDDIVFSIMQLVARAVEGLQLDKISVIDTLGKNLSFGLLKRIEDKQNGINSNSSSLDDISNNIIDQSNENEAVLEEVSRLQPVEPDFQLIHQWFELKEKYENTLIVKLKTQLDALFPKDSYKVAVNVEMTSSENGESAEIKRSAVSIIVDELNENIFLDPAKKTQVFSTVAAIIGYEKERDTIQLSRAPFDIEPKVKWSFLNNNLIWIILVLIALLGNLFFLCFKIL
eukprot:COSAG01_NODE_519_length_16012_cov_4.344058_12_plen_452_part_00